MLGPRGMSETCNSFIVQKYFSKVCVAAPIDEVWQIEVRTTDMNIAIVIQK